MNPVLEVGMSMLFKRVVRGWIFSGRIAEEKAAEGGYVCEGLLLSGGELILGIRVATDGFQEPMTWLPLLQLVLTGVWRA